jgi:hypothetical protein
MLCYVPGNVSQLAVILHPVGKLVAMVPGWLLLPVKTAVTHGNVRVTDATCVSGHHESLCDCYGT